jgi:hypothetical protein
MWLISALPIAGKSARSMWVNPAGTCGSESKSARSLSHGGTRTATADREPVVGRPLTVDDQVVSVGERLQADVSRAEAEGAGPTWQVVALGRRHRSDFIHSGLHRPIERRRRLAAVPAG